MARRYRPWGSSPDAFRRNLDRVRNRLDHQTFRSYVRAYYLHFSISIEFGETPLTPANFLCEWQENGDDAIVCREDQVRDYSQLYDNWFNSWEVGESTELYRRFSGK